MNDSKLNGVAIFPTGIGLKISGDASAGSVIALLAKSCERLIVNPNGCNASDIYVGTSNTLYTEGSTINRFLSGDINLKECKTNNKILCVVNKPILPANINAMNASKWTLGADITLLALDTTLTMEAFINNEGLADGKLTGVDELIAQVKDLDFDILCVHTYISCPKEVSDSYWEGKLLVNPWGKVEQLLSSRVSSRINRQCVHAPIETEFNTLFDTKVVSLQQAAEIISNTYCHCIYSGAHHAPTIDITKNNKNLSNTDIDFMVSPYNCWSTPHIACMDNNIPIIVVKENITCLKDIIYPDNNNIIFVENYLEAAGILQAMNAGIDYKLITLK